MPQRSLYLGTFAGLLMLQAAGAHAEAARLTWSQESSEGVAQEQESPELRTLRLAEEELFGKDEPAEEPKSAPDAVLEAPPRTFAYKGKQIDLAFLQGLKLPSLPVRWDPRVLEYLVFFKEDPRGRELAAGWLQRRERYGAMIRRILEEHGLPTDMLYVAMVESGFDPTARSQVDAWGMWQFMKHPGESYGLRIDRWVDERLDPERSTRAAARFLRDLTDRFGSYELAFAAYNMGYGGLLRAIRKYNTNDYWLLSQLEAGLPFETSLYVAKISALAIIGHNPERFGFEQLVMEPPRALAKVDVDQGTSIEVLAELSGLSIDQIRSYNPHLKLGRTPPGEGVQVYVPRDAQVRFVQRWSQRTLPPLVPVTVRMGEDLDALARRSDSSADELRALNELGEGESVKAGALLFVPPHARPTKDLVEPMIATVPAREFDYPDRKRIFYRVGADDDASTVAQFFEVSLEELGSWNNLSQSAALQPGMLLQLFVMPELDLSRAVVFAPDEVKIVTVGSDEFFAQHEAQRDRERVRYRVQPGDTLTGIGERFDLSAGSLGRINGFASDRTLQAGETLVVYVPKADVAQLAERGQLAPLHEDAPALASAAPIPAAPIPKEEPRPLQKPEPVLTTWSGQELEPEPEPEPVRARDQPSPRGLRSARSERVAASELGAAPRAVRIQNLTPPRRVVAEERAVSAPAKKPDANHKGKRAP